MNFSKLMILGTFAMSTLAISSYAQASSSEVEYCVHPKFQSGAYTSLDCLQDGMAIVEYVPHYGAIDANGVEVIPTKYDLIHRFSEGFAVVMDFDTKKSAYINKQGHFITEFIFDDANDFSEGLAAVNQSPPNGIFNPDAGGWVFLNSQGDIQIPIHYQAVAYDGFEQGYASVQQKGKWGMIDQKGTTHVPFIYEEISDYNSNRAVAKLNGKYGYLDIEGKTIIPFTYDAAARFQDGVAFVRKAYKYALIDTSGKLLTPFIYDAADPFFEGVAAVMIVDKWDYILPSGQMLTAMQYDKAMPSREGLMAVKKNEKWGYADHSGQLIIPYQFDDSRYFRSGIAEVSINGEHFYIDQLGQRIN